jgi:hypothetical protein
MKSFFLKSILLVGLLISFGTSYGQKKATCSKKSTAECSIADCPLKGTADCPLINCPLKGTPDCPYSETLTSLASNSAKGDKKSAKALEATYAVKRTPAHKKHDADLPRCCKKALN